jgi:hypothetical protein
MTVTADDLDTIVAKLEDWVADVGLVDGDDTVLLAGSLASGLGNAASDIDLYVVRREARGDLEGRQFFALGRRIDCHDLSVADVMDETDRLASDLDAGAVPASGSLTSLFRLCHGVPLTGRPLDPTWVDRCRELVARGVVAAGASQVEQAWARLEVAVALGSIPDHELACRAWEEAVMYAALAARGSAYPNQKWNWEKAAVLRDGTAADVARNGGALLREAWPDLPDPAALAGLLDRAGVPASLRRRDVLVRTAGDVRILELGDEPRLLAGGMVHRVSRAVVEVVAELASPRSVPDLVGHLHARHGGARRRVEEAALTLLDELVAAGAVELAPGDDRVGAPTPPDDWQPAPLDVDALDSVVVREGSAASWVRRQYAVWLAWVDYLSHGDDLTGAVSAGQHGAAAAAARALALDLMALRAASLGYQGAVLTPRVQALLRADLGQESRVFRQLIGLATLDGREEVPDLVDRVRALEEELVGHLRLAIGGDLVTDEGHHRLFRHARHLLEAADTLGVDLGAPDWVMEKADIYGAERSAVPQDSTAGG